MGRVSKTIQDRLDELTPSSSQKKITEQVSNYDEISLTKDEEHEALRIGREKKYYLLRQIEYRERITKQTKTKTFSADQLYDFYKMQYDVDQDNVDVVTNLCRYFAEDINFIGDLNKGIFLQGPVGVGKTKMMQFFFKNQRFSYKVESCRNIETNYADQGDNYIDHCSFNLPIAINSDPFGHQSIGFCFDDLGTETNGKHYGKEKNVMAEIILNRYDNNINFISTHITTNLSIEEIKTQYGTRVTDRLRQMFNVIQFPIGAKTRRK